MGKSDRAVVFGALALWIGVGGALPDWLGLADAAACRIAGADRDQPRARRACRAVRGGCAAALRSPLWSCRCGRSKRGSSRRTTMPGCSTASGRQSPAPPRGAIVLFHRGHEHGGRIAHLVDELDLPDFAFFAWDARGHGRSPGAARLQPEPRRLGARRADASSTTSRGSRHRPSRTSPSSRKASARCWSRPGRTTMRPTSAAWCSPRRPSRSSSTCPSPAPDSGFSYAVAGHLLRQLLRQGEVPDARSRSASRSYDADPLITRPIAVNILLAALRGRRARRGRCARDHRADAAADLGRRLGRASRPAAPVLRAARRADQGTPRPARVLPRHASARRDRAVAVA